MKYLIDANIFISSNTHYKPEFFPVLWDFFEKNENVYILDKVYDEILAGDDNLVEWVKMNKRKIIKSDIAINEYSKVANYLKTSNNWEIAAYEDWTSNYSKADPWLIACALNQDMTIVTNENNKGPNGHKSNNEPKIPFVANAVGAATINFWEFLQQENFKAVSA